MPDTSTPTPFRARVYASAGTLAATWGAWDHRLVQPRSRAAGCPVLGCGWPRESDRRMNTHPVTLTRRYGRAGGPLEVPYGDTTVSTIPWWVRALTLGYPGLTNHPTERRLRRAVERALTRHDRGSRRAADARPAQTTALVARVLADYADLPPDEWAR